MSDGERESTTSRKFLVETGEPAGFRVADTVTGVVKEYRNEPDHPAPAITDAVAFPKGCLQ